MKREDLQRLEFEIMEETVKRRKLGGYSADAEGVLIMCQATLRILQHLIDVYPDPPVVEAQDAASSKNKTLKAR